MPNIDTLKEIISNSKSETFKGIDGMVSASVVGSIDEDGKPVETKPIDPVALDEAAVEAAVSAKYGLIVEPSGVEDRPFRAHATFNGREIISYAASEREVVLLISARLSEMEKHDPVK